MNERYSGEPRAIGEFAGHVIAETRHWLEKAVIGLRLCPFAATPYLRGQIRYRVSEQVAAAKLAEDLGEELKYLAAAERSPYPMLHVLREASVQRATLTFPEVHNIGNRNMATLRELGDAGWRELLNRDS